MSAGRSARQARRAWSLLSLLATVALVLGLAWPPAARAHEMTLVDLSLREVAPGDFLWSWGVPAKGRPVSEDLDLRWPEGCTARGNLLHCGAQGLVGRLQVDGVGRAYSAVILRVNWRSGGVQTVTLTGAQPAVVLQGGGQDGRSATTIAGSYGVLGIEHILSGWDHLLFVISLLALVGLRRHLVGTITAFTAAHSLTLASSALGWLTLRQPPVEACIALSILLVCVEALHTRPTLTRQWPALVAFLFGLVHGLGFAGALQDIGLPQQHFAVALLSFNLGVEAGQLLVIAACAAAVWGWRRSAAARAAAWDRARAATGRASRAGRAGHRGGLLLAPPSARTVLLYAMGAMAAYWTWARLAQIAGF